MAQLVGLRAGNEDLLVLASGGIDSTTLLHLAVQQQLSPGALFVDYGQAAAEAEFESMQKVCATLDVPWRRVKFGGSRFGAGEIRGRNAFLLHVALLEFPSDAGVVAIGIHAGTGYPDCSPEFMTFMNQSYEFHTGGRIGVEAPFLHWAKQDVYRLFSGLSIPSEYTHSCEASNVACGRCRSCLDRNILEDKEKSC